MITNVKRVFIQGDLEDPIEVGKDGVINITILDSGFVAIEFYSKLQGRWTGYYPPQRVEYAND